MSAGSLVFAATPIGNLGDITTRAEAALRHADLIVCEDTRHSRKLLSHLGIEGTQLLAMHQHNEESIGPRILEQVRHGKNVVVISDAGMPGISDPGSRLARDAVEANIEFDVMPGASAVLMALVLSGFDTSRFVFEGFLPQKQKDLFAHAELIAEEKRSVVLFEAPHRVVDTLEVLLSKCGPDREVAVIKELTKIHQNVWRGRLEDSLKEFDDKDPKGEFVIVVRGAHGDGRVITDEEILASLAHHGDRGYSTKDAVAAVAEELSLPKNRVYALATQ